ncbi:DUF4303 domain-containing protein [Flavobacterium sp. GSB-24]|uniref:DUF4303 domain-containing protein n=1 Tax=Flavobacterium sp. GSB-24 TaxID=2994319 RepID=UPI002490196B|nr:DUF4303 domain-containing protein [Flavobacterium sp. GSB-24]BDU24432.1 hypothetical protein FLGSB24_11760 [Flavobacterium sp. GSB-24]
MDRSKIKQKLIDFTTTGVQEFLSQNPDLEFYAFAYSCNAEDAQVNLCFNTIQDFEKTLNRYKNGRYSEYYRLDEAVKGLKYNIGDWEYMCFDTINVLSEEELNKIFNDLPDDDYKSWKLFVEELMELFCECLLEFRESEIYKTIPKNENFVSFSIDHDEDFEDAEQRMLRVENKKSDSK